MIQEPTNIPLQMIRGLILEHVTGTVKGRFRRVGFFGTYGFNDFEEGMKDPSCWAEDSLYESLAGVDDHGSQRFYISLV
jgi:hypothetical protein